MNPLSLNSTGRALVLAAAFAGWLCAGPLLAITSLAMQSAAIDLLGRTDAIDRPLVVCNQAARDPNQLARQLRRQTGAVGPVPQLPRNPTSGN